MARFFTIASGSSGNSAYVGGSDGGILVDAGISCKGIVTGLEERGVSLEQVHGVLVTHEHVDHIRGLRVFLKRRPVPVYGSPEVLDFLAREDCVPPAAAMMEVGENEPFQLAGMDVTGFPTPHDSVHSLGYRIHTADDRWIGVATDLGHVTNAVREALLGCDLVLLESNYEHTMLMNGPYPYPLKKRIAGQDGHLSNGECADLLPELVGAGTTRLVLAHLSKENNLPELAYGASMNSLNVHEMAAGEDFLLSVAERSRPGELIIL